MLIAPVVQPAGVELGVYLKRHIKSVDSGAAAAGRSLPRAGILKATDQGPQGFKAPLSSESLSHVVVCVGGGGGGMTGAQTFPAVNADGASAFIIAVTCSKVNGGV